MPRRHGADGGQAVTGIIVNERGYDDALQSSTPRSRRSLTAKNGSHNRRFSRRWCNLARVVNDEVWDNL